jgi:hypothetical protein
MAKTKLSKGSPPAAKEGLGGCPATGQGTSYSPPNLQGINPSTTQFEPTSQSPIRQHKQMSGVH